MKQHVLLKQTPSHHLIRTQPQLHPNKYRHLAHLATKLAELSIQTDRLASLCKINARQSTDQRELAIYYGSMLMATTRVFNLDESNGSESEDQDDNRSSPNQ
ncbi:hypothetical protein PSTT_07116 [Puccinia striiformis]|uniref:Uncharacterized protein n=1 Tax=Puccinia striiformis TaxID=27350 RepID=A0A2S4VHK3_9BASI|nr:hypothetical protein PSTT_07116 [Puccinia striiformis]